MKCSAWIFIFQVNNKISNGNNYLWIEINKNYVFNTLSLFLFFCISWIDRDNKIGKQINKNKQEKQNYTFFLDLIE